ncbi:hypothetical protein B0172_03600 [Mycobacterium avium subsp. paratuberculosis]|nr:hypothetical protein B0172_03600 [Mycobacterium avium subsp. paratuberculosis]OVF02193.1 hypothetical protein B0173_03813 [Mycobacterium avium subsp. paratuberculosis]
MTLTDPRDALADQSDFIGYLVGLAGLADVVHTLAGDGPRAAADPRAPRRLRAPAARRGERRCGDRAAGR